MGDNVEQTNKFPEEERTTHLSPGGASADENDVTQAFNRQAEQLNGEAVEETLKELPVAQDAVTAQDVKAVNSAKNAPSRSAPSEEKSSKDSLTGEVFDRRYQFLDKLGEGGMGMVYKAEDMMLNRIVAIKLLKLSGHNHNEQIMRFQQEAQAAARLKHPNIISVYDLCTASSGEPYILFEFVDGVALSKVLKQYRKREELIPLERVLDITLQTCDALQSLHDDKVIHRDIKPGNMMLEKRKSDRDDVQVSEELKERDAALRGRLKLVDFGLAKIRDLDDNTKQKITRQGQAVGTLLYMSPEQCYGDRVDGRSDIYSLGCVLYEMLCGHVPFHGEDVFETMNLHANGEIPSVQGERSDLPMAAEFDRIFSKLLAKKPDERYQTIEEVRKDLEGIFRQIGPGIISGARYASITNMPYLQGANSGVSNSQTIDKTVMMDATQRITGQTQKEDALERSRYFGGLSRRQSTRFVIVVAVLAVVASPFVYSWSRGVDPILLPELIPTSWNEFDLRGQHAFNEGALTAAEDNYKKALAKARLGIGVDPLALQTTLHELRVLYTCTKNRNGLDRVNTELLSIHTPPIEIQTWNKLAQRANSIDSRTSKVFLKDLINDVVALSDLTAPGDEDAIRQLRSVISDIKKVPKSELFQKELELILHRISKENSTDDTKDLILEVLAGNLRDLSPRLSHYAVVQALKESNPDLSRCEAALREALTKCTLKESVLLKMQLAQVFDRQLLDKKCLKTEAANLEVAQRVSPRDYVILAQLLFDLGSSYQASRSPNKAAPLLQRSVAIWDADEQANNVQDSARDMAIRVLAESYVDLGNIDLAEAKLVALESAIRKSQGTDNLSRARTLALLGYVCGLKQDLQGAKENLVEAIRIFESKQPLNDVDSDRYLPALSNLGTVYAKLGMDRDARRCIEAAQAIRHRRSMDHKYH